MLASPLASYVSRTSSSKARLSSHTVINGRQSLQKGVRLCLKDRHYCKAQQPEQPYKPSYDPKRETPQKQWPRNRKEELAGIAKKVHPTAILREASPSKFSYRVRIKEHVPASKDEDIVGPVQGLLKPPPIMQKTDPFVREQQLKRKARVEEILGILRRGNEALSITQVTSYYQELEQIKVDARKEGFDLVVDREAMNNESRQEGILSASEDQFNLGSSSKHIGNSSYNASAANSQESMLSGARMVGGKPWTLAGDIVMQRRIEELLANEDAHLQAGPGGVMGATRRLEAERKDRVVTAINELTIPRLFGLIAQTALVFPFAILRGFRRLNEPEPAPSILSIPGVPRDFADVIQQKMDIKKEEVTKSMEELAQYRRDLDAHSSSLTRLFTSYRLLTTRGLGLLLRTIFITPFTLAWKVVKMSALWVYYFFYAPLDIAVKLYHGLSPSLRNSGLIKPFVTTWHALAPLTWKRYYLGDPLGTLWDRNTGHSEQTLQETRDAFNDINYGLERLILGFLHSNRVIGLLSVLLITSFTAGQLIPIDPSALVEFFGHM